MVTEIGIAIEVFQIAYIVITAITAYFIQTDPAFKDDKSRLAARTNVRLALPYVRCSILDAMNKAIHIGSSSKTNFEPKPGIELLYLNFRKDCNSGS